MKTLSSLSSQGLATVYVAGASLLLTLFLARQFGPDTFGRYSYIVTVASLWAILQDGGFRILLFREGTQSSQPIPKEKQFPMAFGHLVWVTLAGLTLTFVWPMQDSRALSLAVVAFGLGTLGNFISGHLKGEGRFHHEAVWRVLYRSGSIAGIVCLLSVFSAEPHWVFLGWIMGYALCLLLQRYYPLMHLRWAKPEIRIYKSIAALLVIDIATLIYFKIDIVMLRHLMDEMNPVGYYAAASRLLEGVLFLLFPLANVYFRNLRLMANEPARFFTLLYKLIYASVATAAVLVVLGLIYGEPLFVLGFGDPFREGTGLLHWLLFSLLFMVPNLILTQAALAIEKDTHYALGAVLAALINVALNVFLIPQYGAKGAAVSTLITEGLLLCYIAAGLHSWRVRQAHANGESI